MGQTNCLTSYFYEDALKRAAELDAHYERSGQPIGALHGLPVSIKVTGRHLSDAPY